MTIKHAPSWKRLLSYLLDAFLTGIVSMMIYKIVGLQPAMEEWLTFAVFMTYNILMDYKFQGTLGKMFFDIMVIRTNGQRVDLKTSFYRNFGKIFSALPLYWGFVRMLTPSYPQGIHDEMAKCFVVEKTERTSTNS